MKPDEVTGELPIDIDEGKEVTLKKVDVGTLDAGSEQVLRFIHDNGISEQQWVGGRVYLEGDYVGLIDYEGKFWGPDTEKGKLPKLQQHIDEANAILEERMGGGAATKNLYRVGREEIK